MRKIIIGIFYGPHKVHKTWFDIFSYKINFVKEYNFSNIINKKLNIILKFILIIFNFQFFFTLIKNYFNKKYIFLEGFYFLAIIKFFFPHTFLIAVVADPIPFRILNGNHINGFIKKLYVFFLRNIDILLANSKMVRDFLLKIGINENKIFYLTPYIDNERKEYIDKNNLFVSAHNLTNKKLITIANGNDVEYKGIDILNNMADSIKILGWEIEVIGAWNKEIIQNFPNLRFLGKMKYYDMYNYLYKNCSLGIVLGQGETFSCAALEMGYMKFPIIVGEYVGFREILENLSLENFIIKDKEDIKNIILYIESHKIDYYGIGNMIHCLINKEYNELYSKEKVERFLTN